MTNIDITLIVCCLAGLAIGGFGYIFYRYIKPWISTKITESQWLTIIEWAKTLVALAEKTIYGEHGLGGIRYDAVLEQLQELCNKHGYSFDGTMLKSAVQLAWQTVIGKSDSEKSNIEEYKPEISE